MVVRAPAKLNLCLYLGPRRQAPIGAGASRDSGEGLHELVSLFCPLTLSDRIEVSEADGDEVVCEGVDGPNLATVALEALRARGWQHPPARIEIEKRIPIAAGLGGGSADAAAVLRLAGNEVGGIEELAAALGADVPSQLDPRMALVSGAGERVQPLPTPAEFAVVLIPAEEGLATADVYAAADRQGLGRPAAELAELGRRLRDAASGGGSPLDYAELLVNDLQHAALALRPEIVEALSALEQVGAAHALIAGSGPTAVGIFDDLPAADRAVDELPPRFASALVAAPFLLGR